jgi:hypothetical protein
VLKLLYIETNISEKNIILNSQVVRMFESTKDISIMATAVILANFLSPE